MYIAIDFLVHTTERYKQRYPGSNEHTPHPDPDFNAFPHYNEPQLFMPEFRSGAGKYKKSLENLLMPDVFSMIDRESVMYDRDTGASLQGLH